MKYKKIKKYLIRVIFPPIIIYQKFLLKKRIGKDSSDVKDEWDGRNIDSKDLRKDFLETEFLDKDVRISFILPSRARGNHTFALNKLLESIIKNASDIKACEVVVVVDKDDNLGRFAKLKNEYKSKIRLKIIISDIRYSYIDFHKYFGIGIDHSSKYTKMLNMSSDDMTVEKKGFDLILLDIDKKFKDNLYIIHSIEFSKIQLFGKNHKSNIEIDHMYKTMFYVMTTNGIASSYFPFVSKGIYDVGKELESNKEIEGKGWSYIANSNYDWYTSMIGDAMSCNGMEDRIFSSDIIRRDLTTVADYHVKIDKYGFRPNQYLFQVIFEKSTIAHIKKIALSIKEKKIKT